MSVTAIVYLFFFGSLALVYGFRYWEYVTFYKDDEEDW